MQRATRITSLFTVLIGIASSASAQTHEVYGEPYFDANSGGLVDAGAVFAKSLVSGSLWFRGGDQAGGLFGFSLDHVGDLTGDGTPGNMILTDALSFEVIP